MTPELQYFPYRTPYYENGEHLVALFQEPSLNTKIISSLEVKAKTTPLSCGKEDNFTIAYTLVGEEAGVVDLMYLVSGPAGLGTMAQNISFLYILRWLWDVHASLASMGSAP